MTMDGDEGDAHVGSDSTFQYQDLSAGGVLASSSMTDIVTPLVDG